MKTNYQKVLENNWTEINKTLLRLSDLMDMVEQKILVIENESRSVKHIVKDLEARIKILETKLAKGIVD